MPIRQVLPAVSGSADQSVSHDADPQSSLLGFASGLLLSPSKQARLNLPLMYPH